MVMGVMGAVVLGSSGDAHAYLPAHVRENWADARSISIKVTKVLNTSISECSGDGSGEGSGEHGDESSAGIGSGSGIGAGIGACGMVAASWRVRTCLLMLSMLPSSSVSSTSITLQRAGARAAVSTVMRVTLAAPKSQAPFRRAGAPGRARGIRFSCWCYV